MVPLGLSGLDWQFVVGLEVVPLGSGSGTQAGGQLCVPEGRRQKGEAVQSEGLTREVNELLESM